MAVDLILRGVHDDHRVDGVGERDGFAHAVKTVVVIGRGDSHGSDHSSQGGVDSGESRDVALAFSSQTDFRHVVDPSVSHLAIGDGGGELNRQGLGAVAVGLVLRSVHDHLRIHRVGEGDGITHTITTVVVVGRGHSHCGNQGSQGGVDSGESRDVALAFSGQTDFRSVVDPSVSHLAVKDGRGELDGQGLGAVAVDLVLRSVHDHLRVQRDGEAHRLAHAVKTVVVVGGSHRDDGGHGHENRILVHQMGGGDVADTRDAMTKGLGSPGVGHLTIGDGGGEHNRFGSLTIAVNLIFRSVHNHLRVHRVGEGDGLTNAVDAVVGVGGDHGHGGDQSGQSGVDGGEGRDVALAFGSQTDLLVDAPVVGHLTIFEGGGELDGQRLGTMAVNLVLRSVHDGFRVDGDGEAHRLAHAVDTIII